MRNRPVNRHHVEKQMQIVPIPRNKESAQLSLSLSRAFSLSLFSPQPSALVSIIN